MLGQYPKTARDTLSENDRFRPDRLCIHISPRIFLSSCTLMTAGILRVSVQRTTLLGYFGLPFSLPNDRNIESRWRTPRSHDIAARLQVFITRHIEQTYLSDTPCVPSSFKVRQRLNPPLRDLQLGFGLRFSRGQISLR